MGPGRPAPHLRRRPEAGQVPPGARGAAAGKPPQAPPHVTRLVEAGVDLLVIRDLLGHASVATTQVYAHVARRRLREAIERLE